MTNSARTARGRSCAYAVLAGLFRQPDDAFLAWLTDRGGERTAQRLSDIMSDHSTGESLRRLIIAGKSALADGGVRNLVAEYNRLFSPLPTIQAPLWASAYAPSGNRVMGEPARLAQQVYSRAGFSLAPGSREHPDHLTVQLGFLSRLTNAQRAARWRRNREQAARWATLEQEFISLHVQSWVVPHLLPRLRKHGPGGFYAAAGDTLLSLLTAQSPPNAVHPNLRAETVSRKKASNQRLPQMQAGGTTCTLCGVCSGVCPTGALELQILDTQVRLLMQDDLCDACNLCVRTCPERAVRLRIEPIQERPGKPARILSQSTMVMCSQCRLPLGPRSMLVRTTRHLGALTEFCPICRMGASLLS